MVYHDVPKRCNLKGLGDYSQSENIVDIRPDIPYSKGDSRGNGLGLVVGARQSTLVNIASERMEAR